jgi:hypothetical protein
MRGEAAPVAQAGSHSSGKPWRKPGSPPNDQGVRMTGLAAAAGSASGLA